MTRADQALWVDRVQTLKYHWLLEWNHHQVTPVEIAACQVVLMPLLWHQGDPTDKGTGSRICQDPVPLQHLAVRVKVGQKFCLTGGIRQESLKQQEV